MEVNYRMLNPNIMLDLVVENFEVEDGQAWLKMFEVRAWKLTSSS